MQNAKFWGLPPLRGLTCFTFLSLTGSRELRSSLLTLGECSNVIGLSSFSAPLSAHAYRVWSATMVSSISCLPEVVFGSPTVFP